MPSASPKKIQHLCSSNITCKYPKSWPRVCTFRCAQSHTLCYFYATTWRPQIATFSMSSPPYRCRFPFPTYSDIILILLGIKLYTQRFSFCSPYVFAEQHQQQRQQQKNVKICSTLESFSIRRFHQHTQSRKSCFAVFVLINSLMAFQERQSFSFRDSPTTFCGNLLKSLSSKDSRTTIDRDCKNNNNNTNTVELFSYFNFFFFFCLSLLQIIQYCYAELVHLYNWMSERKCKANGAEFWGDESRVVV